jgi:hypothetical protein
MMSSKLEEKVQRAKKLEQKIEDFRVDDRHESLTTLRSNAMEKLFERVREVAECYEEAFSIYCQLDKEDEARSLLEGLFEQVKTCDGNSSSLAIHLLLSVQPSLDCLERWVPGTKERLTRCLHASVYHRLSQYSRIDLPLIEEALKLMSRLAGADEGERRIHTIRRCHIIELAAQTDFVGFTIAEHPTDRQGKLAAAIWWCDEGKRIAQSVSIKFAEQFASRSSRYRHLMHRMPPEPLFAAPLGNAVAGARVEQHTEAFLPTVAELYAEYEPLENKLESIIADDRLLLDDSKISLWAIKHPNSPLKEILLLKEKSGQEGLEVTDSQENPIGVMTIEDEFRIQYLMEIEHRIASLFSAWQALNELTADKISDLLQQGMPNYDWKLFSIGVDQYFQGQYIPAAHIMVPQFEGLTVAWGRARGCVKKIRRGEQGEYYLSDLVKDDKFRILLGEDLCDLIFWYMVNREAAPFNHRNNLAHGFVAIDECNWVYLSAMTIWLALKVATSSGRVDSSVA